MTDLRTLTHDQFAACLAQRFGIDGGGGAAVEAELIDVQVRGTRDPDRNRKQAFSVVFRGPTEPILPQQIYRLSNATLGDLELFLVPVGPDATGQLYEAVFT